MLSVPEIRDYERINAELVQCLDDGHPHIRLLGAEGQRLLASGLVGGWSAVVEVEGRAGPELGAALDAPGVTIVCRGAAADGAGCAMRAGRLIVLGGATEGVGYAQEGGTIVVAGGVGARAGLNQRGGLLLLLEAVGRLAGERQSGGLLVAHADRLGPHAGRATRGGRMIRLDRTDDPFSTLDREDGELLRGVVRALSPWLAWPQSAEGS